MNLHVPQHRNVVQGIAVVVYVISAVFTVVLKVPVITKTTAVQIEIISILQILHYRIINCTDINAKKHFHLLDVLSKINVSNF